MFERHALPTPFQVGPVNAYLAGRTVVDPGPDSEDARTALAEALAERDLAIADVEQVLVTHAHPDHFGLANHLRSAGADVLASPAAATILQDFEGRLAYEQTYLSALFEVHGMAPETIQTVTQLPEAFVEFAPSVTVDRELTDGDVVAVADGQVRVREHAGHSECDLVFEWREEGGDDDGEGERTEEGKGEGKREEDGSGAGVGADPPHGIDPGDALRDRDDGAAADDAAGQYAAIVGDQVLPDTTPNPFLEPPEQTASGNVPDYADPAELDDLRPRSLLAFNRSLEELRDAGHDRLLPGHGEVVADPQGRIDEIRAAHEERSDAVLEIVDGDTTAVEVMRGLFPDLPVIDYFPGMSEAIGHLDVLMERGEIVRDVADGELVYRRA